MANHDHAHNDYKHGEMDISEQSATFDGFIKWSAWVGILTIGFLFAAVLVYGAHYNWLGSIFAGILVSAIFGGMLKLGTAFWVSLAGIGVISVIASIITFIIGLF